MVKRERAHRFLPLLTLLQKNKDIDNIKKIMVSTSLPACMAYLGQKFWKISFEVILIESQITWNLKFDNKYMYKVALLGCYESITKGDAFEAVQRCLIWLPRTVIAIPTWNVLELIDSKPQFFWFHRLSVENISLQFHDLIKWVYFTIFGIPDTKITGSNILIYCNLITLSCKYSSFTKFQVYINISNSYTNRQCTYISSYYSIVR